MTGEIWLAFASCGIFDEHGNHAGFQCGSQTTIIIMTTMKMEIQL